MNFKGACILGTQNWPTVRWGAENSHDHDANSFQKACVVELDTDLITFVHCFAPLVRAELGRSVIFNCEAVAHKEYGGSSLEL